MKKLTKEEPKYITLVLVSLVSGWDGWVVLKHATWVLKTQAATEQNKINNCFLDTVSKLMKTIRRLKTNHKIH